MRLPAWLLVTAVGIVALGALVLAETEWLPEFMDREYASRTTLAVIPHSRQGLGESANSADGQAASASGFLDPAMESSLLEEVISKLDLRGQPSGQSMPPDQLRQQMRISSQCIEISEGEDTGLQGVFLSMTVRGSDRAELAAITDAWADALTCYISGAYPTWTVERRASFSIPYRFCADHEIQRR